MRRNHRYIVLLGVITITFFVVTMLHAAPAKITAKTVEPQMTGDEQVVPEATPQNRMFFSIVGQRIAAFFQNLNTSINHSFGIPDADKNKISTELNSDISWFQREAVGISITEDENKLQKKIDGIRNFWLQREYKIKYYISLILSGQELNAINRLEALEPKFTVILKRLDQQQPSTKNIQDIFNTYTRSLRSARSAYTLAQSQMSQITNPQNSETSYQASRAALNEIHVQLQQARASLQKLVGDLKNSLPPDVAGTQQPSAS